MKQLLTIICIALLIGCAKTPTETPFVQPTPVTPSISPIAPALAWYDLSDSLLNVHIDKTVLGAVTIDTASVWVTAYTAGTAYDVRYIGYKSLDWTWAVDDTGSTYYLADSVKLELTYWFNDAEKQTVDLWAVIRKGEKQFKIVLEIWGKSGYNYTSAKKGFFMFKLTTPPVQGLERQHNAGRPFFVDSRWGCFVRSYYGIL